MQCVYDSIIWCGPMSFHSRIGAKLAKCPEGMYMQVNRRQFEERRISNIKMPLIFESASYEVKNHQHTCTENYWDSLPAQLSQSLAEKVCCEEDHPCCIAIVEEELHLLFHNGTATYYGQKRICLVLILHKAFPYNNIIIVLWLCRGLSKESYIQWRVTF